MTERDVHLLWREIRTHRTDDYGIFAAHTRFAKHPHTGAERRFTVLEGSDWTNVIAVTPTQEVVLVRQFRHGTQSVTLEIPGGAVDAGESHRAAAERELREETGYVATGWTRLGTVHPNPALQNNRCSTWLAQGAQPLEAPTPDAGEVIEVELRPLSEIGALISRGAITHALVLAAFHHHSIHQSSANR